MSKNEIVKILGGLGVILGVFSFLVLSTNFDEATNGAKYAFNGLKNNNYILTNLTKLTGNSGKVSTPPNVVEGFFDVSRPGDWIKSVNKKNHLVTEHYRAIKSEAIKKETKQPVLKLEIYNHHTNQWVTTQIARIDKENGEIYFLLKTQNGDKVIPNNFYTGTYQLIFN